MLGSDYISNTAQIYPYWRRLQPHRPRSSGNPAGRGTIRQRALPHPERNHQVQMDSRHVPSSQKTFFVLWTQKHLTMWVSIVMMVCQCEASAPFHPKARTNWMNNRFYGACAESMFSTLSAVQLPIQRPLGAASSFLAFFAGRGQQCSLCVARRPGPPPLPSPWYSLNIYEPA